MRKGDEIFSKDELAALRMFAKNAVEEDKKLHGITEKEMKNPNKTKTLNTNFYKQEKSKTVAVNNNNNKSNQFTIKKEEKKPPPVQQKPVITKPVPQTNKKEENIVKKQEPVKNIQSQINEINRENKFQD